jgi:hypothetical protein
MDWRVIALIAGAGVLAVGVIAIFAGAAKLARREGPDTQKSWDGEVRPVLRDPVGDWPVRQHYDPTSDIHLRAGLPGELTEPIRAACPRCLGERFDDLYGSWCACAKEDDTTSLAVPATYISERARLP